MKLDRLIPVNDFNETKPPKEQTPKKNKFKIHVQYRSERDIAMREILKFDSDVEFKTNGGWDFKIRTKLNSGVLYMILLSAKLDGTFELKNAWFF